MKPIKPRKLSKQWETHLKHMAEDKSSKFRQSEARTILAALEYERQRADDAEKALKAIPPQHRNGLAAVIMREMMGPPSGD